uniref:PCI domain-containing protein n=1 Tax=Timema monikensis TaxID=170555 RepID=A0A7R9HNM3_9NEOP|nr:unnamed protein product [Timema monikensis]
MCARGPDPNKSSASIWTTPLYTKIIQAQRGGRGVNKQRNNTEQRREGGDDRRGWKAMGASRIFQRQDVRTTPPSCAIHPTEIRTSISPSLAAELNTTSALANYATEADSIVHKNFYRLKPNFCSLYYRKRVVMTDSVRPGGSSTPRGRKNGVPALESCRCQWMALDGSRALSSHEKKFWISKMADNMAMDTGKLVKMEVDYESTCDEKIPECIKMSKEGKTEDALDSLLALEKQTRTGADMVSTGRVLVAIVQICFEAKNWSALNEHILLLSKRRSQLKQAVAKMVQECCKFVDEAPDKETKVKLIDTLRTVTEGKIYVEVERARLTHKLAKMKEDDGDVVEAANIIQELQVETYGSMNKKEKVELILEQMRLCLAKKDYVRTQIISKKVNTKFFDDEETQELKLKYFRLMIELDQHEGSYLSICKHYRAVLATPTIQGDADQRHTVLQHVVCYLVLAQFDHEQADLTHRVLEDKLLDEIPLYKKLLQLFTTPELIKWGPLCEVYELHLKQGSDQLKATDVFSASSEQGRKRWQDLRSRVVEHNIRIMAKYYTKISVKRMSELLDLSPEETEEILSQLVVSKAVTARTDRPAGVVSFTHSQDPGAVLTQWSEQLSSLMQLVNRTTHLINKEEMVHKHLLATATIKE